MGKKISKLRRQIKRAEQRINRLIHWKIEELKNDKVLMNKIESELAKANTKEKLQSYIKNASKISKAEHRR